MDGLMNANIFKFELRLRLKSALIWSIAIVAVSFTYLALYPSLSREADLFDRAIANFPPQFLEAFGMQNLTLQTIMGFYSFVFLFIQVLLAIQASMYGFGLVSVDEAEMTADFLLTRPVTRTQILTSKFLAAFIALTITNAVVWVSSLIFLQMFDAGRGYDRHAVILLLSSIAIFQLFFLTAGAAISLLVKRVRSVTPYAMGLAFGMYLLGAFSGMLGDVKLELITPFKHFDPNAIIHNDAWNLSLVAISVAVILISIIISYWRYLHRDIPAVA